MRLLHLYSKTSTRRYNLGNTRMRAQMEHEGREDGNDIEGVVDSVVDEIMEVELAHKATNGLGGQARLNLGPATLSFNSMVMLKDQVSIKGALGKTIMRVERGTDVADSLIKFAKENSGDINFIRSEYGDTE